MIYINEKKKEKKIKYNYIYNEPKIEYLYNTNYNLIIKKSNIVNSGLGVFSNEKISKNTFLGYYIGKKCKYNYPTNGQYAIITYDGGFIEAIDYPRTFFAMINDSYNTHFNNNCEFIITEKNVEIRTIKNIKKYEELFISYGNDYWK
jgi:SET domain-containing protein